MTFYAMPEIGPFLFVDLNEYLKFPVKLPVNDVQAMVPEASVQASVRMMYQTGSSVYSPSPRPLPPLALLNQKQKDCSSK